MAKRHQTKRVQKKRNLLAKPELNTETKAHIATPICKSCGASIPKRHGNKLDDGLLCKACEARWNVSLASPYDDTVSTLILSTICFALSSAVLLALIYVLKRAGGVPLLLRGKAAFIWISPLLFYGGRRLANFIVSKIKLRPATWWAECTTAFIVMGGLAGSYIALKWLAPDSINLGWALAYCVAPLALGFILETQRWERFATV